VNGAPPTQQQIEQLISQLAPPTPHQETLIREALTLALGDYERADIKMVAKVMRELRQGLEVFAPYHETRKVSIFGSARTSADDPRYQQARSCAEALREAGFMIITGGGGGMMQAANEGAGERHSFAININLPMEQQPNPIMVGSPRHFYCQYFFTRKLFFLKESSAVVLTPGGFGTLDEAFETLTLLQTGRNPPLPVVLLEAPGDDYWGPFLHSWVRRLVRDGLIDADDQQLLFHTDSIEAAVTHIRDFYYNYHSFRYVGSCILLRMHRALSHEALARLNAEFSDLLCKGSIEQVFGWPKSDDACYAQLPRLRLHLDRRRMNSLLPIIQRMNALSQLDQTTTPTPDDTKAV